MIYVLLALTGLLSGTLGGMGMGGGTLLIPLLTILFGFNQKNVQGINLISFSIMAIIIVIVHIKNKLIVPKIALFFSLFALITAILGAMLATVVKISVLKYCFGGLLIVIAIVEAVEQIKTLYSKKE